MGYGKVGKKREGRERGREGRAPQYFIAPQF